MDHQVGGIGPIKLRLTLESLNTIKNSASRLFNRRNALLAKIHTHLQIQLVALISSIAICLYLGFHLAVPVPLIAGAVVLISVVILRLKFTLIRVRKSYKLQEPEVPEGSILATIAQGEYRFYLVEKKSEYFFYLTPVNQKEVLSKFEMGNLSFTETPNKKTLFLHKKRVFNYFYHVRPSKEQSVFQISA